MDYFPLFCQLRDRDCLIVGGGAVAERKARLLLETGANLTINAPDFTPQFQKWAAEKRLVLKTGFFQASLLENCWLVIAATNEETLQQRIAQEAETRRIFCNLVDSPQKASFIMPALIDRSPLLVAVSTGGASPVLARLLREKLEAFLPFSLGRLAAYAGKLRDQVKAQLPTLGERRHFWEKFLTNEALARVLEKGNPNEIAAMTAECFSKTPLSTGEISLVGAGPGAADLLTLKGLQKIQQADVILYDRLVSDEILSLVRRDAVRLFVGKEAHHHSVPQTEIHKILLNHARQGKKVVRLKGGDPFIFGRGGEELEAICAANIPFCVVPGITAASGCAAYAGIPLTHRDYAQSVIFITGHLKKDDQDLDWQKLASEKQTLVFYMGLSQAGFIALKLMEQGMKADLPVALIEKGTTSHQKVIIGKLSELGHLAKQAESPALIIIGHVTDLHRNLHWFPV